MHKPEIEWYIREGKKILRFDSSRAELISATDARKPVFTVPEGGLSGPLLDETEWLFRTKSGRFFEVRTDDNVSNKPPQVHPLDESTARQIVARHADLGPGCVRIHLSEPRKEIFS